MVRYFIEKEKEYAVIVGKTYELQMQNNHVNVFEKNSPGKEIFYTQVISRILYFDMHLSRATIAHGLQHRPPLARANLLAPPRVFRLPMLP